MIPEQTPAGRMQDSTEPAEPPSIEAALAVLRTLVRLKDLKDRSGETADYRENKDAAWDAARKLLGPSRVSPQ